MKVSADYRMLALDALRGKWKTAVLTGIAASALGATIVSSSNSAVSNSNQAKDIHFELFSQPNGGRLLAVLLAGIVLWAVLQLIVGGAVQLGYAHFNLNLVDGNDAAISDLFSQKDRLWDGFCMKFLQGLYIALWSLLLVIPGIVKTYSYAMTPYIMSEHPSLTANEAITESRRIMNGNKWRLFCLDFSFIGWELLCSLPLYAGGFLVLKYFTGSEAMAISLFLLLTIPLSIDLLLIRAVGIQAGAELEIGSIVRAQLATVRGMVGTFASGDHMVHGVLNMAQSFVSLVAHLASPRFSSGAIRSL